MLILLIDDDADDLELFREALQSVNEKAKCLHALDGQEAIHILNNVLTICPDYILLDINMPKMGGKECLINPQLSVPARIPLQKPCYLPSADE